MGKRCLEINNGKPCSYLASNDSCLLKPEEIEEKCPARETTKHEEKNEWMKEEK